MVMLDERILEDTRRQNNRKLVRRMQAVCILLVSIALFLLAIWGSVRFLNFGVKFVNG